jgi:multiple sugar transport system permease protein
MSHLSTRALRARRTTPDDGRQRGIISDLERRRPVTRVILICVQGAVLIGLILSGLMPLLWLARAAVAPSQDILSDPLGLFMNPTFQWENLAEAWTRARIGDVLGNTAIVALGTTAATLVVSFSCAYVLSVLRPRWAPALNVGIMVTLFIPGVISLVPLYLTVVKLPILGVSLINNYAATWLPAAANAFIILIVKRFFDAVPRDLVEAARIDGAGPVRILVSVYLPLSAPIAGVVALLTVVASWKDFLWPLLVLPSPSRQPISVALAKLDGNTALNVQLAAMFLALLVPVLLFMVFQRQFLQGAGMAGAVKG